MPASTTLKTVRTDVLEIAYEETGPSDGFAVVLLHGFPYDPRAYDAVVARLAAVGLRAIVPYLRGYGPTRFLSPDTPRSGQQAALGHDLMQFLDVLALPQAVLAGFDWGGRAACIVAALWPGRVRGLVSCAGYNIQDITASVVPADPEAVGRVGRASCSDGALEELDLCAPHRSLVQSSPVGPSDIDELTPVLRDVESKGQDALRCRHLDGDPGGS